MWRSKVTSSLCWQTTVLSKWEEIHYTRRGGGHTCGGQYLPRKCSCATCQGLEGLGGQSPNPETRESRPLQAGGQRTGRWHMRPHNTPQPITNHHGGEDEKTWKQTNQNQSQRQWREENVEKKSEEKRWVNEVNKEKMWRWITWGRRAPRAREKMNKSTGHSAKNKRHLTQNKSMSKQWSLTISDLSKSKLAYW